MPKLLNRRMLQYIKQGNVLYGQEGIPLPTDPKVLKHRSNLLEYYFNEWIKLHENSDVALNSHWYTGPGRGKFVIGADSDKFNKDFDNWVNQHYIKNPDWNRSIWFSEDHYLPIETDENGTRYIPLNSKTGTRSTWLYTSVGEKDGKLIHEVGSNETLQQYLNKNYGSGHTVKKVNGEWRVYLPASNNVSKAQVAQPTVDNTATESTTLDEMLEEENKNTADGDALLAQIEKEAGVSLNNSGNESGNDSGNNSGNDSGGNEGSIVSEFQPLKTDVRDFKPSVPGRRASGEYRLVRRPTTPPVARPTNMPLMNRSDVRYTVSDVTKGSPYGSSDIELVNSLANTPDSNMFKQALMNRLGMSKWDNTTALNRLNYLGVKGHIGGSDRKRLRNLINKGTTVEGTIRK